MDVTNIRNQNKCQANGNQSLADETMQPTPVTSYTELHIVVYTWENNNAEKIIAKYAEFIYYQTNNSPHLTSDLSH
jgi:hypothetical protein